jgi:hypothetical protein
VEGRLSGFAQGDVSDIGHTWRPVVYQNGLLTTISDEYNGGYAYWAMSGPFVLGKFHVQIRQAGTANNIIFAALPLPYLTLPAVSSVGIGNPNDCMGSFMYFRPGTAGYSGSLVTAGAGAPGPASGVNGLPRNQWMAFWWGGQSGSNVGQNVNFACASGDYLSGQFCYIPANGSLQVP